MSVDDLITWSDEFVLGIDHIDEQHRGLVEQINALWLAMLHHEDDQVILGIILRLFQYTQTHFIDEESLMRAYGYGDLESHRHAHADFVQYINQIVDTYVEGNPISNKLLRFLNDWLRRHILGEDRAFAVHITNQQGGAQPVNRPLGNQPRRHHALQGLDVSHAISSHLEWLDSLFAFLSGAHEPFDPKEVLCNNLCILGAWIETNEGCDGAHLEEFRKLNANHSLFHLCASEAVKKHLAGDSHGVEELKGELRLLSNNIQLNIVQLYIAYLQLKEQV